MINDKQIILDAFSCGIEFEFFTKMPKDEVVKSLGKTCKKKITIPKEVSGFNKTKIKVHSDFKPTTDSWTLEPEYSGGKSMLELVTGPLKYAEARIQIIKVLNWIKEHGWTTKKTGIHLNISYQNQKLSSKKNLYYYI